MKTNRFAHLTVMTKLIDLPKIPEFGQDRIKPMLVEYS